MNDLLTNNGEPAVGAPAIPASSGSRRVQDRVVEEEKEEAAGGVETAGLLLGTHRVSGTQPLLAFWVMILFHQLGPLGRVGLRVAMSVCLCVCLCHRVQFFSRPLIGPQIT